MSPKKNSIPSPKLITDEHEGLLLATKFLTEIGIPWDWADEVKGFLDGVEIMDGGLRIAPNALVSNVLHEAGHVALIPGDFRHLASGGLNKALTTMMENTDFSDPDAPAARAAVQCSDPEVTAWAYAAGVHLGLDPSIVIKDDQYDNDGRMIRLGLSMNGYAGINGLSATGFCAVKPGAYAQARGLPAYPELKFWLQPSFDTPVRAVRARP